MVCVDSLEAVGSRAVCQSSSIYTAQLLHFSLPKTTTCALSDCQCRVKGPSTNIVALSQFQFDMVWHSFMTMAVNVNMMSVLSVVYVGRGSVSRRLCCHRPFPFLQLLTLRPERRLLFSTRGYSKGETEWSWTVQRNACSYSSKDMTQAEGQEQHSISCASSRAAGSYLPQLFFLVGWKTSITFAGGKCGRVLDPFCWAGCDRKCIFFLFQIPEAQLQRRGRNFRLTG